MRVRALLVGLLVLAAASCGDDGPTGPEGVSIDGTWSGSTGGVTVTMTFTESDGSLTGSGTLDGPSGSIPVLLDGTRDGTSVVATLSSQGYEPTTFTGTIQNATSISGHLSGSGFNDVAVTLSKE